MVQERCVRDTPRYGRLWKAGEVRTADTDENGEPVASPHFRLVGADEIVRPDEVFDKELVQTKKLESAQLDRDVAIRAALSKLDPSDRTHWTAKGLPSLGQLHIITQLEVSRAEVMAVAPDFDRESAEPASQ